MRCTEGANFTSGASVVEIAPQTRSAPRANRSWKARKASGISTASASVVTMKPVSRVRAWAAAMARCRARPASARAGGRSQAISRTGIGARRAYRRTRSAVPSVQSFARTMAHRARGSPAPAVPIAASAASIVSTSLRAGMATVTSNTLSASWCSPPHPPRAAGTCASVDIWGDPGGRPARRSAGLPGSRAISGGLDATCGADARRRMSFVCGPPAPQAPWRFQKRSCRQALTNSPALLPSRLTKPASGVTHAAVKRAAACWLCATNL